MAASFREQVLLTQQMYKRHLNFVRGVGISFKHIENLNVDAVDWLGNTPLHAYLMLFIIHKNIVRQLLDLGASVSRRNNYGFAALHCAFLGRNCKRLYIFKLLIDKGADVDILDYSGNGILHYALCRSLFLSVNILELIVKHKADDHLKDEQECILRSACKRQLPKDVIEWLFQKVDCFTATNGKGETLLHLAARNKRKYCVQLILERHKIDVDVVTKDGSTPLHYALTQLITTDFDTVQLLLRAGADVNQENKDGNQPLHLAAEYCDPKIVQLLLSHGAHPNGLNRQQRTALDLALIKKNRPAVKLLLDCGALVYRGPSSRLSFHNSLHLALLLYNQNKNCNPLEEEDMKILKLLLKYALLERPDLSFSRLASCQEVMRELEVFEIKCRLELQFPCSKPWINVAEFIQHSRRCPECPTQELIEVSWVAYRYPIYAEVILGIMSRMDLVEQFGRNPLYVASARNPAKHIKLNYDASCGVLRYLNDTDLLNLAMAVYRP